MSSRVPDLRICETANLPRPPSRANFNGCGNRDITLYVGGNRFAESQTRNRQVSLGRATCSAGPVGGRTWHRPGFHRTQETRPGHRHLEKGFAHAQGRDQEAAEGEAAWNPAELLAELVPRQHRGRQARPPADRWRCVHVAGGHRPLRQRGGDSDSRATGGDEADAQECTAPRWVGFLQQPRPARPLHNSVPAGSAAESPPTGTDAGIEWSLLWIRSVGGHRTRPVGPWGNVRRRGVPDYVSVVPLASGGVCARLGANP